MRSLTLEVWRFKDVLRPGSLVLCQRDLRRLLRSISNWSFLGRILECSECTIGDVQLAIPFDMCVVRFWMAESMELVVEPLEGEYLTESMYD